MTHFVLAAKESVIFEKQRVNLLIIAAWNVDRSCRLVFFQSQVELDDGRLAAAVDQLFPAIPSYRPNWERCRQVASDSRVFQVDDFHRFVLKKIISFSSSLDKKTG